MNKKLVVILLFAVVIVGSLFSFYGTNMLFSDICNLYAGFHDAAIIGTLPMIMLFSEFMLAIIYLARLIKFPAYKKAMTVRFFKTIAGMCVVGFIFSILTGIIVYKSFFKLYPFPFYPLVMCIANVLLGATAVYAAVLTNKRMEPDAEKRKHTSSFLYTLYTFLLGIFLWLATDRLGAFLYFPTYIQWRMIGVLWPNICAFPFLMSMLAQSFLYCFDFYNRCPKKGIIYAAFNFVFGVGLSIAGLAIYNKNSAAVAALSLPMGLERCATSNITSYVILIVMIVLGFSGVSSAVVFYQESKKKETEEK